MARKRDCHRLYAEGIGGPHAALVSDVYRWCRDAWACLILSDACDRERLRDICLRTLAFENDFLRTYIDYLSQELAGGPAARDRALEALALVPLDAAPVREALHALAYTEPAARSAVNILAALGSRHIEADEV